MINQNFINEAINSVKPPKTVREYWNLGAPKEALLESCKADLSH
jgi:hypothetical protein